MFEAQPLHIACSPDDPVDLIPFFEKKFAEIRAVLAGYSGDERHRMLVVWLFHRQGSQYLIVESRKGNIEKLLSRVAEPRSNKVEFFRKEIIRRERRSHFFCFLLPPVGSQDGHINCLVPCRDFFPRNL